MHQSFGDWAYRGGMCSMSVLPMYTCAESTCKYVENIRVVHPVHVVRMLQEQQAIEITIVACCIEK